MLGTALLTEMKKKEPEMASLRTGTSFWCVWVVFVVGGGQISTLMLPPFDGALHDVSWSKPGCATVVSMEKTRAHTCTWCACVLNFILSCSSLLYIPHVVPRIYGDLIAAPRNPCANAQPLKHPRCGAHNPLHHRMSWCRLHFILPVLWTVRGTLGYVLVCRRVCGSEGCFVFFVDGGGEGMYLTG